MKETYIISAVRTPIGAFGGSLSSITATNLGGIAFKAALEKAGVDSKLVQELLRRQRYRCRSWTGACYPGCGKCRIRI